MTLLERLKHINRWLEAIVLTNESLEELSWAPLRQDAVIPKAIPSINFLHYLFLPFVFIQGLAHIAKAFVNIAIGALENDKEKKWKNYLKAGISLLVGSIVIAGGVLFLTFDIPLLSVLCFVTSGIELFWDGKELFLALREWKTTLDNPEVYKEKKEKIMNSVITKGKNLLFSASFIGLIALSFIPIPIVSHIAQLVLLGLIVYKTIDRIRENRKKYSELLEAKQTEHRSTLIVSNDHSNVPSVRPEVTPSVRVGSAPITIVGESPTHSISSDDVYSLPDLAGSLDSLFSVTDSLISAAIPNPSISSSMSNDSLISASPPCPSVSSSLDDSLLVSASSTLLSSVVSQQSVSEQSVSWKMSSSSSVASQRSSAQMLSSSMQKIFSDSSNQVNEEEVEVKTPVPEFKSFTL